VTLRPPFPNDIDGLVDALEGQLDEVQALVDRLDPDEFYALRVFVELSRQAWPKTHRLLQGLGVLSDEQIEAVIANANRP
jgi:hypothetical protein